MMKPSSVKYSKKETCFELVLDPFSFENIVQLFGKNQLIEIYQLNIFQEDIHKLGDYDYNEDFFAGIDTTFELFLNFLNTIGKHKILNMVFETANGTCFIINENAVKITFEKNSEKHLQTTLSLLQSEHGIRNYNKVVQNQGRFVYFNETSDYQVLSNSDLWYKFEACVN